MIERQNFYGVARRHDNFSVMLGDTVESRDLLERVPSERNDEFWLQYLDLLV